MTTPREPPIPPPDPGTELHWKDRRTKAPTLPVRVTGIRDLLDRIDAGEHLRRRVVQDAMTDALARTWTRRADQLADALPRPADHPGGPVDWQTGALLGPAPTDDDGVVELLGIVRACRAKAAMLEARWLDE